MGWLHEWLGSRDRGAPGGGARRPAVPFTLKYGYFRELLAANDEVLEIIAGVDDARAGGADLPAPELSARLERAMLAAFVMVKNLNLISEDRYLPLYDTLTRVHREITAALAPAPAPAVGPLVVPLAAARRDAAPLLGAKMANLGEVRNRLGLAVPDGFVVTAAAFDAFIAEAGLGPRIAALLAAIDPAAPAAAEAARASAAIQAAVRAAALPAEVMEQLGGAVADLQSRAGAPLRLAVRSSAIGEDGRASCAGQYQTILNVGPAEVPGSVLEVVASLYSPGALAYRRERALREDARMAVGCIRLVDAVAGGVMFTRDPAQPDAPHVLVEAVPGQGASAADGTVPPDRFVVRQGAPPRVITRTLAAKSTMLAAAPEGGLRSVELAPGRRATACLGDDALVALCRIAALLEAHFGAPQDVEWALDRDGRVFVLQTRPLACAEPQAAVPLAPGLLEDATVLVRDGVTACPGVGAGPVVRVDGEADLDGVPEGAVLVARHSSPAFARVMPRVSAIVTEVGGRNGHMAIVARELGVPAIVGAASAAGLAPGGEVTVDATRGVVLRGRVAALLAALPPRPRRPPRGRGDETLERVAQHVCPLHLTEPESPGFQPSACTSLHDVTRFAHEKTYAEMFHIGDDVRRADEARAVRLRAHLPIDVYVFDLGGGLRAPDGDGGGERTEVGLDDVTSAPLRAFAAGLLDERIRWDRPRPVSVGGFLSVLGESMLGPPPSKHSLGRRSFAMASDTYLNFSTRAGYHFSTVDTYCGRSINKNYVHFRFVGGAAAEDRRTRRAAFVAEVLRRLGFAVRTRADLVTGRLQKYPREHIAHTLELMGRLTLCCRQLDMLMDSDAVVAEFVEAFLGEKFEAFA
jgi:pyruvate,water dikinase